MARRTVTVVIDYEGRDKGKIFKITEMSATQSEAWASRLLLALMRGNVQVPDGFFSMGMEAIAVLGIRGLGGLPWHECQPLLDEMFRCIVIQPGSNAAVTRALIDDDTEELSTRLRLREAWIDLHLGFSMRDKISNWTKTSEPQTNQDGGNISTFPPGRLVQ